MNEIYQFFSEVIGFDQSAAPIQEIVFAILLSFSLNWLIASLYKATYHGGDFSQDYVHTLLILGTVVSVIVMVVHVDKDPGKSQATAFGVFAAFSLIRFRSSVGQARDIGFIFFAMSAGLGVGARADWLATATTIVVCAIIYVFSKADAFAPLRASHRLRVRVTNDIDHDVVFRECFASYLHDFELISVESIQAGMMTELRYLIHLKNVAKPGEFVAAIQQLNGNNRVLLTSAIANRTLSD